MPVSLVPGDAHDGALRANVHPADWTNPTPAGRYHLVVVGAGPAGLVAAAGGAALGARVALIERDLMGGDCLNVGCVPSKALIRASRAVATVRRAADFGVRALGVDVDFAAVMERVRRLRARLSATDSAARFRGLGVDVFLGEGRFSGRDTIEVAGQTLRFRRALIATGARPARPSVTGLAEAGYLTNENVFTLTALPPRLAVLGGGPIGCELAQAFARLGARVWMIDRGKQILHREEPEAAERLAQALRRDGVELVLGKTIERVEKSSDGKLLHLQGDASPPLTVDEILVGLGRQPNVESLNLEAAQVRYDPRLGVRVNNRLRTSNRRIYAAGDVCSTYKFTHAADAMARIVLRNALFPGRARASALTIPWCTYTEPELAHVGLTEQEARQRGYAVHVFLQELRDVDRAVLDGEDDGFVKVVTRAGSDTILGASILAVHAGEMIAEVTLAMTLGRGLRALADTIHPYPTQAEALRKLGDAYQRTRLTPMVKWLLAKWLKWTGG